MEQTLSCYIEEWMQTFKAYSVKQSPYDRRLASVKALEDFQIASMSIGEVTSVHIQKYVNELAEYGYGLSTIKKQMRIVTAPLKQAAALHQIPADPAVGIRLPSRSNVLKAERTAEVYSQEEQEALWVLIDTHQRAGYAAVGLMIETGLRVGEALALCWRDVNLGQKRLRVRSTVVRLTNKKRSYAANKKKSFVQDSVKSESSRRTIPLTAEAIKILEKQYARKRNEWVFANDDGERLSYEALRYQTRKACKEAGIEFRGSMCFAIHSQPTATTKAWM